MPQERSSDWFKSAFGELYPVLYPHRDDESAAREVCNLIRQLQLARGGAQVLDLCCGNGRHAASLAEMGFDVYGLDLSPELLARAAARCALCGRLVRGDLRQLPFGARFDLVVNLFTSFGYFSADKDNTRALREMARVLRPGGQLVIDHINSASIARTLVPEDTRRAGDHRITQRRRIAKHRVRKEIRIEWDDGRTARIHEDVRLYTPEEMRQLLNTCGLTDVRFYGSFDGAALTPQAERMIVRATQQT
jgi:ubiquinone/menaquinone biosynthesis C-methylase UbiE